jgi:hypothetical protein
VIGYYASVTDGKRHGLLLGPYPLREVAEGMVGEAARRAERHDVRAAFYGYGVARVAADRLPPARLGR